MERADDRRFLHCMIEDLARERPDAVALTFTDGRAYTRGELWHATRQAAAAMRGAGVGVGDRVLIMLENRFEFVQAFLGAVAVGGIPVTPHTAYRGQLLANMMGTMGPSVIVTEAALLGNVVSALELTQFTGVLAVVDSADPAASVAGLDGVQAVDYATWVDVEPVTETATLSPLDVCTLMYTSGTTGASKGNIYPYSAIFHMLDIDLDKVGYGESDVAYTCTALYHGLALFSVLFASLYAGGQCVVAPKFSASGFWDDMRAWKITKTFMVGAMANLLDAQPESPADRDHCVDTIWCAPPPARCLEFQERFGVRIDSGYGLSDFGWLMWMPRDEFKQGSCGKLLPGIEVIVADDHDNPVPVGEPGELLIRPKHAFTCAQGYFGMPEATAAMLRNAWYHTGDMMRVDADGWYYFVDRKKDYMRRGGENISSIEVEDILNGHPGVIEAAAYGVPSDLGEDDVMVALVLRDGTTLEEVGDYAEQHLPYYAVPRYYDIVDALPRTPSQKVTKVDLRRAGVTPTTWDRGRLRRSQAQRSTA